MPTSPQITAVVIAGGVGSRLWPLSRSAHPKPFIKLSDGTSLIQRTYARILAHPQVNRLITVTNQALYFHTKAEYESLQQRCDEHIYILEPCGRNSTAAIALAAHHLAQQDPHALMLVLPADHMIEDHQAFYQAIDQAVKLVEQRLVTFGIEPTAPETGYGYIEAKGSEVKRFVEKPDQATATAYVNSGQYLWNSGMFCMQARLFLSELKHYRPAIHDQVLLCLQQATVAQSDHWQQVEIAAEDFEPVEDISVDYAIFEHSAHVAVVSCDIGWSDIGSWTEFGALSPKDASGNHLYGHTLTEDTSSCIIHAQEKLIATLGIQDLIITDTADALLVVHKDRAQDVRTVVKKLAQAYAPLLKDSPTVHRPWGCYTVLLTGEGFKLKKIIVQPGASLSLQSHQHRNEHWVVVSGTATVTRNADTFQLCHNQSTYIPAGDKHRLKNNTDTELVMIEVQCGDYLGEDDIQRFDDVYSRCS